MVKQVFFDLDQHEQAAVYNTFNTRGAAERTLAAAGTCRMPAAAPTGGERR